jgi:hypothetical protein
VKWKQNKNVNHKNDALYKTWLGLRFKERELFNKTPDSAIAKSILELCDENEL